MIPMLKIIDANPSFLRAPLAFLGGQFFAPPETLGALFRVGVWGHYLKKEFLTYYQYLSTSGLLSMYIFNSFYLPPGTSGDSNIFGSEFSSLPNSQRTFTT